MATSGPGATNLVTAIADAKLDSVPVADQGSRSSQGVSPLLLAGVALVVLVLAVAVGADQTRVEHELVREHSLSQQQLDQWRQRIAGAADG